MKLFSGTIPVHFFFVLFLINEEKVCSKQVDRLPCLGGQTGTFRWTDCLVCVERLAHLGGQIALFVWRDWHI